MEIRLFDKSKLTFEPTKDGGLSVQLWTLGNWRDGHGYLLTSGAIIGAAELEQFLAALTPPEQAAA